MWLMAGINKYLRIIVYADRQQDDKLILDQKLSVDQTGVTSVAKCMK